MKNKGIIIFLVVLGLVITGVIIGDFLSTRPDRKKGNPYEYNVDEFKGVDPSLILYRETKNFETGLDSLKGLSYCEGNIYLAGDHKILIIDRNGKLLGEIVTPSVPSCVLASGGKIYAGLGKSISIYETDGKIVFEGQPFDENSVITSLAVKGDQIYVADAGKRKVYRLTRAGAKIGEFEGKTGEGDMHGFMRPSPYFDLGFNPDGELWVVNPGKHSLENYTDEGVLRGFWDNTSMKIEGFSGCCNPAQFTFLPDGNFVTSEKGLVRIKIYKPSGDFLGVVAPPSAFNENGHAPDVSVDEKGNVYALDFDRKMIRVFEPLKGS